MNGTTDRIRYKILVCDADDATRNKTINFLDNEYSEITYTDSGLEAIDLLTKTYFDIMITDLILFQMDGFEVIKKCKKVAPNTAIVVFSDILYRDLIIKSIANGAKYALNKDNHYILWDRVRHLVKEKEKISLIHKRFNTSLIKSNTDKIEMLLMEMGFKPSHKGFEYLVTALELNAANPHYSQGITKLLYPEIAKLKMDKPYNVEKLIRSAINYAWDKRYNTGFLNYTNRHKDFENTKPTNAEFISIISANFR